MKTATASGISIEINIIRIIVAQVSDPGTISMRR